MRMPTAIANPFQSRARPITASLAPCENTGTPAALHARAIAVRTGDRCTQPVARRVRETAVRPGRRLRVAAVLCPRRGRGAPDAHLTGSFSFTPGCASSSATPDRPLPAARAHSPNQPTPRTPKRTSPRLGLVRASGLTLTRNRWFEVEAVAKMLDDLLGLAGLRRSDAVGPHHLVVLVLDDVAVPDELAGVSELRLDARDLAGVGDDRVLEAGLPRLRRGGGAVELDRLGDLTLGRSGRGPARLTTSKAISWMCIGWASAVVL